MKLPIPCSVIAGASGAGKSSFIASLLAQKPQDEKWAIIVNQPNTSRDSLGSALGQGVTIREMAGGCVCCQTAGLLGVAIAQLLRKTKPDRLLIEPSAQADPKGLLQTLQTGHLAPAVDVHAVICLVDVRRCSAEPSNEAAAAQLDSADVLVGSKVDLATQEQAAEFKTWAAAHWPFAEQVLAVCTTKPDVDLLQLLDAPRAPLRVRSKRRATLQPG